MSHEIQEKSLSLETHRAARWLRRVFVAKRRISVPVTLGLVIIVGSQLIPATSSSVLWLLHSWGAYVGAVLIAYGLFPLIANLDDEDSEGPVPPSSN